MRERRKKTNGLKLKLNGKKNILIILIAIIAVLLVIGIFNLIKNIFSGMKIYGNEANMGLAIADGNEVYYNKYDTGIVKVKSGKEYQITNESAVSMVKQGDYIYYLTVSLDNTIALKSVKTNGEDNKLVKDLYTPLNKFYMDGDVIYYVSNKDHYGIDQYNIKSDTTVSIVSASIDDFVFDGKNILYTDTSGKLYSVSPDDKKVKTISDEYSISKIQVVGKWIYFYDQTENALCKIRNDGKKRQSVATFVNNETYNVTNKGIYYFDQVNKQICKCDLKGKKSEAIVKLDSTRTRINIANKTIYYLDSSNDENQIYQMFRVKTNGKSTNSIDY